MKTYIALLRGINVGGHKKILMADLRSLLESAGFKEVRTYIQSGNIIFKSDTSTKECENIIVTAILKKYGWEVPVIVKIPSEIKQILNQCPFSEDRKQNSYFTLLDDTPDQDLIDEVQPLSDRKETFHITDTCIYFWSENYARTKFHNNFFERKLKVRMTSRNYRTMVKLISLSP